MFAYGKMWVSKEGKMKGKGEFGKVLQEFKQLPHYRP